MFKSKGLRFTMLYDFPLLKFRPNATHPIKSTVQSNAFLHKVFMTEICQRNQKQIEFQSSSKNKQ